jgi:hypothetical protein
VNAPHALATRPPTPVDLDEQTGLTALLELFSAEESPAGTPIPARSSARPPSWTSLRGFLPDSPRDAWVRLSDWTRVSSRRAAAWGSGPQGAWRAW